MTKKTRKTKSPQDADPEFQEIERQVRSLAIEDRGIEQAVMMILRRLATIDFGIGEIQDALRLDDHAPAPSDASPGKRN